MLRRHAVAAVVLVVAAQNLVDLEELKRLFQVPVDIERQAAEGLFRHRLVAAPRALDGGLAGCHHVAQRLPQRVVVADLSPDQGASTDYIIMESVKKSCQCKSN